MRRSKNTAQTGFQASFQDILCERCVFWITVVLIYGSGGTSLDTRASTDSWHGKGPSIPPKRKRGPGSGALWWENHGRSDFLAVLGAPSLLGKPFDETSSNLARPAEWVRSSSLRGIVFGAAGDR